MSDITKTICKYAWDYPVLAIARNELRFCCRTNPEAENRRLPEAVLEKGKHLFTGYIPIIEVRKSLLRGERHKSCGSCWQQEDNTGFSQRNGFDNFVSFVKQNRVWPKLNAVQVKDRLLNLTDDHIEDLIKIDDTRMIEIMLDNTCDLKCVYCNHQYSSQWAAEKLKYKEITIENIDAELPRIRDTVYENIWWDWFENNSGYKIYCINFIGGEPLIIDKFYSYVRRVLDFYETTNTRQAKIDLSVVSNFNTPKKYYEKFLDLVIEIVSSKKVQLDFNVSCESIGNRAEFIRTGTNWKLLDSNIRGFLESASIISNPMHWNEKTGEKIIFNLQIALNALCISDLPNFFRYVVELQKSNKIKIHLRQNQIVYPTWLNVSILPPEYATYIDESIEILTEEIKRTNDIKGMRVDNYSPFGRWDSYIQFLETIKLGVLNPDKDIEARKQFVFNIDKLSQRRNLNFAETFPEMVEFYNSIK